MAIQFFIYFIECVHLLHLSTAECMEKGWLWRASSESWNFYLMHQLNRTYVDTLEDCRFDVPLYLNVCRLLCGRIGLISTLLLLVLGYVCFVIHGQWLEMSVWGVTKPKWGSYIPNGYQCMTYEPVRLLVSASPNQPANSVFLSQKTSTSQPKPAPAPTSEQAHGF